MTLIHHGDCVQVMADMPEASIDAIVCDPPYGLEFMGKEWDRLWDPRGQGEARGFKGKSRAPVAGFSEYRGGTQAQSFHEAWATAALRVAKPGAYLLAFGGTRTVHRMTVALEDAGWIIRDMLVWAYASGFPKSRALLKPAWEPIVMARKPGPLRDLDIDGCRIGTDEQLAGFGTPHKDSHAEWSLRHGGQKTHHQDGQPRPITEQHPAGRWPANIVLTDPIFDGDTEGVVGGGESTGAWQQATRYGWRDGGSGDGVTLGLAGRKDAPDHYGDTGTYSRFFLLPKASRRDREPVMPGMLEEQRVEFRLSDKVTAKDWGDPDQKVYERNTRRRNVHPTVKPIELMRHLVRLVTPAGGTVLDPFLGSGTTALAAEQEGRAWVGIEREAEYVRIATARLAGNQQGMGLTG